MLPPKIILLGGNTEQVNAISAITPRQVELVHYPFSYQLTSSDLKPQPGLILFILEENNQNSLERLETIQRRLKTVPIIVLADNPAQAEIIEVFRRGVDDFFTFPLNEQAFLKSVLQHSITAYLTAAGYASPLKRATQVLSKYWRASLNRFRRKQQDYELDTSALRFIPNELASSFLEEPNIDFYDIRIQFFGQLKVEMRGNTLPPIPGKKVNSILAYLLYNHAKPIHREKLMGKFWGDNAPSSARNSLNVAIHTIRKQFQEILPEQDVLIYQNQYYSINSNLDIITDVELFMQYWQKGNRIEKEQGLENALGAYNKAAALYQGDFLEDMLYEEWSEAFRDNLKETYLFILDRQSNYFFSKKAYGVAINICKKMLAKDPCMEDVHRKLIICYKKIGHRDKAVRQYQKCEQILRTELNMPLSEETKALL